MEIKELIRRPVVEQDKKLKKSYAIFKNLVDELKKKKIPEDILNSINQAIADINSFSGSPKDLRKLISKSQSNILKLIEKELELVPKNFYRNRWLAIGISVFGIPLGVVFGFSLGNMAFLGMGIPIGMAIGMAVGAGMDQKAFKGHYPVKCVS